MVRSEIGIIYSPGRKLSRIEPMQKSTSSASSRSYKFLPLLPAIDHARSINFCLLDGARLAISNFLPYPSLGHLPLPVVWQIISWYQTEGSAELIGPPSPAPVAFQFGNNILELPVELLVQPWKYSGEQISRGRMLSFLSRGKAVRRMYAYETARRRSCSTYPLSQHLIR